MKRAGYFISILATSSIFANTQVSLKEALDIGLKNSDEEKISRLDRDIAWQKYEQTLSALYPTLTLNGGVSQRDKAQTFDFNSNIDISQISTPLQTALGLPAGSIPSTIQNDTNIQLAGKRVWQSSLILSYPIYTGGKITALKNQANINTQIQNLKAINSTKNLKWRITQAYAQAWWAKSMQKAANDTYERMNFTYEMTKYLIDNGSIKTNKTDLLRTKSFALSVASMENEFKVAYDMSVEYLNFVTNSSNKIEPLDELDENSINSYEINSNDENLALANPTYMMTKLAIKAYEAKKDEVQSEYLPSILLSVRGTYLDDDYEHGYFNSDNRKSAEAMLGFEWKIFEGFLTNAKDEEARLEVEKSKIQNQMTKKALIMQIKQAKIAYKGKKEQITNLQQAYDTALQNRKLHQRAYKQELVSAKDMLESQVYESLALGSLLNAKKELILKKATLEKLSDR